MKGNTTPENKKGTAATPKHYSQLNIKDNEYTTGKYRPHGTYRPEKHEIQRITGGKTLTCTEVKLEVPRVMRDPQLQTWLQRGKADTDGRSQHLRMEPGRTVINTEVRDVESRSVVGSGFQRS